VSVLPDERPLLRGVSHAFAFGLGVVACATLLGRFAGSAAEFVGAAVFSGSLLLLYGCSATYHTIAWRPGIKRLLKRFDHALIFVLIAGTYTPLCLLVLPLPWWISLLSVTWGLATAGVVLKLAWIDAPRWLSVPLYLALGWLIVAVAPLVLAELTREQLLVLAAGGASYTLGAFVYALKWPDPAPRFFGYHEVFHVMVVAGTAMHYALVASLVAG
jgi:hemolysin III